MKGDFSRFTFDHTKRYQRVLEQQGRVHLDADWNEQVAILLERLETLSSDLIGPFGGPTHACGFVISPNGKKNDFNIGKGRYYVDGVSCENDDDSVTYLSQPFEPAKKNLDGGGLIYLDVWEDYVNAIEDEDILEKGLGGLDTAGRSKIFWQVLTLPFADPFFDGPEDAKPESIIKNWPKFAAHFQPPNRGHLSVRLSPGESVETGPCIVSPTSRYRGAENQLYRIEIHHGGTSEKATFKWSRENGSVVFAIASGHGKTFNLQNQWNDPTLGLEIDDWVELVDDATRSPGHPGPLLQVKSVPSKSQITVDQDIPEIKNSPHSTKASVRTPYLRRWDQKGLVNGADKIVENAWLPCENGIEFRFEHAPEPGISSYRTGDYWYVPVRTANNGEILVSGKRQPDGIVHHYAPLATMVVSGGIVSNVDTTCLKKFDPFPAAKA
ncbi:hypothetical protein JAO29_09240 [Edaphobacter sp. HDX4]|uniref:DUF6519 domain-containing protein n=1 Tax=Edaphobacter sp. HDX4 TaxID=2794064 RepID=UPI002FE61C3E